MTLLRRTILGIVIFFANFFPLFGKAVISKVNISLEDGIIYLRLSGKNFFTEEVKKIILAGGEVKVTFIIDCQKKSSFPILPDRNIKRHEIIHKVTYDILKKEFVVFSSEASEERTTSIEEAEKRVSEIKKFPVISERELKKEFLYYIRVKAYINSLELYPPLGYIFDVFTPLWNFSTPWRKIPLLGGKD